MSEQAAGATPRSAPLAAGASPGAILKAAREKQGLHIAALAASIKVTPRKLEALEADRYSELPDLTFARALAKAVCRALKIDPEPVLAMLPRPGADRLEHVANGLNAPFRGRSGVDEPVGWGWLARPVVWAPASVLLAALILYLLPQDMLPGGSPDKLDDAPSAGLDTGPSSPSLASAPAQSPGASAAPVVDTVHSSPPLTDAAPVAVTAQPTPLLVLQASAESWVEVRDASGQVLVSRILLPNETLSLEGALPMRATIGNAAATKATFRGQPLDLSSFRDNVARLELK